MSSTLIINNSGFYTHQGIQELFYKNNIADVNEVTILPEFVQGQLINRAYVQVEEWHDSEAAFNFIKEMDSKRGAIISSLDDDNENFCIVKKQIQQKNIKQNLKPIQSKYTKYFQSITKQNLDAQIQEYEAELEQEMQQMHLATRVQIAIPMF